MPRIALPKDEIGFAELSVHALRRWRMVLLACVGVLGLGLLAWALIPRREEPLVDMPVIAVVLAYPGATPEDVETQVVKPLEEVLLGLDSVEYVESTARPNAALFTIKLEEGSATDVLAEKVRGTILGRKRDLPAAVEDPEVVVESTDRVTQMVLAVSGFSPDGVLTAAAKRVKADLITVPGVAGVDLRGQHEPAVRVRLDPVLAARHGLGTGAVVAGLQAANSRIPGGEVRVGELATLLEVSSRMSGAADVRAVALSARADERGRAQVVHVEDVAEVTETELTPRQRFLAGSEPAVGLEIRFRGEADAVAVGAGIRARLEALRRSLPPGVSLRVVHDQPAWISRSVRGFITSLLEGILLVMVVVGLGMGLRPALVVSAVIPLSIGCAVVGLLLLGFTLDMISISGLIVALGLLVDDAVVVTDSIQLLHDRGLSRARSAVLGTARVFWANNATTAVAIASFVPLFFMGSDIGSFLRGLPVAVILALGASLIAAQLATPWLATLVVRRRRGVEAIPDERPWDRADDSSHGAGEAGAILRPLYRLYDRLIPAVLAHPGRVVALATAALAASLALFPLLGVQFFPRSDRPMLFARLELATGTRLETTTETAREALEILRATPGVLEVSAAIGAGYPMISDRPYVGEASGIADFMVKLRDRRNPAAVAAILRERLARLPGARITVDEVMMGPPVEHPVLVRVYGDDYDVLRSTAEEIKARLRAIPGTINVDDSLSTSVPLTRVRVDGDRAALRGLDAALVGETLRWLYSEDKVTEFRRGDDLVQVVLDVPRDERRPLAALEEIPVANGSGALVPVRSAAQASLGHDAAQLRRRNGRRIVEVSADVTAGVLADSVLSELDPWLRARPWPAGYGFVYAGEQEEIGKSFSNLAVAATGALLLIGLLLVLVFDDLLLAGIVVLLVPFALIGALPGLALTGNPFSMTAFLGLIALTGVFVNHKIYYVNRMQELESRGLALERAVGQAGRDRLRPVVLTALTAVLGLVPLTLGSPLLWGPFGWVNIFGLVVSIPLSLIVLPACVVLARRAGARLRGLRRELQGA